MRTMQTLLNIVEFGMNMSAGADPRTAAWRGAIMLE